MPPKKTKFEREFRRITGIEYEDIGPIIGISS